MQKTIKSALILKSLGAIVIATSTMTAGATPAQAGLLSAFGKAAKKELTRVAHSTLDQAVDSATAAKAKKKGKVEASWKVEEGEALSQNGTTVPSADEVQAPQDEEQAALLLPAVQKYKAAQETRARMSQNGTTVETADEVQAPQGETRGLLLPAVQPRFQGGVNVAVGDLNGDGLAGKPGMSQNGTTVETADEVQAPQRPQRARLVQNGTTVATAGEIQAPQIRD